MSHESWSEGSWKSLDRALGLFKFIAIPALAWFTKERFVAAFTTDQAPIPQAKVALLLGMLTLIWLWEEAGTEEIQIAKRYLYRSVPKIPGYTFLFSLFFGISLYALAYYSDRILIFSGAFACFNLVGIWATWIRNSKLKEMLSETKKTGGEGNGGCKAWTIIEEYYFDTPQAQLGASNLFLSFVALMLGLLARLLPTQPLETWLISGAYATIMLSLVVNEVLYSSWRRKRDHALGDLKA